MLSNKWFTIDLQGKGRIFFSTEKAPKSATKLYLANHLDVTTEDGDIVVLVDGIPQIDPAKKAARDARRNSFEQNKQTEKASRIAAKKRLKAIDWSQVTTIAKLKLVVQDVLKVMGAE